MNPKNLHPQESETYFWYAEHEIGRGATGQVYKCREKTTGKDYAVKVFNGHGMGRPSYVNDRELEVLNKLKECKHENIVKVIAIEEQKSTGSHAIIMELCAGGSLHTLLEKPENAFGLEEDDFKQVLNDVVSGMKYLNDQGMIHRDIKPGNILKYVKDDGSSVYKLTDFGAARELAPEEAFMSIYGTEEYLHPDLYEKGVLKKSAGKTFGAHVDLWSLGATFYHVATGKLPFRPYGGRTNRHTMFEMTTKKNSGIISGIQKSENGEIEWSDKLPEHTRLSPGLKEHVVNILARLLECDTSKQMTFDELFQAVQQINQMKVIHVYSAGSGTFHMIYANPDDNFARFQELIAIQTNVSARQQDLFYNNDIFKPSNSMAMVSTYPDTTIEKPIIVLGGDTMPSEKLQTMALLKGTKMQPEVSIEKLESDLTVSKMAAKNFHWCLHAAKNMERSRILTMEAAENVITLLKRKARKYLNDAQTIESHCHSMVMKHEACLNGCDFEKAVMETLGTDDDIPQEIVNEKEKLEKETKDIKKKVNKLREDMKEPLERLRKKAQSLLADGELAAKWKAMNQAVTNENYVGVVQNYTSKVDEIVNNFYHRHQYKNRLCTYDMENHKFERFRLEEYFTRVKEALDACQTRRQTLHDNLRTWLEEVFECRTQLKRLRQEVHSFVDMFDVLAESEQQWRSDHMSRMENILKVIRAQVRKAISVPAQTTEQQGMMVDGTDGPKTETISLPSELTKNLDNKLSKLSSETKEAKLRLQENTQKFQRFVQELIEGLNEKSRRENGE